MLVCFNGARCNWDTDGSDCCACRGGRALCPLNRTMCAKTELATGVDYDCSFDCSKEGGQRPCGSMSLTVPTGFCTPPPPLPPMPPPVPPSIPHPPWPPLVREVQISKYFHVLLPLGTFCDRLYYTMDKDYSFDVPEMMTAGDGDSCANSCLRTSRCTGFQQLNDPTQPPCILWFDNACSSSSSRGITHGPESGATSILQYVRSTPLTPTQLVSRISGGVVFTLLLCTVICTAYQRYQKHAKQLLLAQQQHEESEKRRRLSSLRRRGSAEKLTRFYAKIEAQIRAATQDLNTSAARGDESTYAKFNSEPQQLVFGQPADAARGIGHFMQVADTIIHAGMARGVDAIVEEFERGGTDDDRECLAYVLRERAGSSSKLFSNSQYPRDCDANGVRSDRRNINGEGMLLSDFVAHSHATTAGLQTAQYAAPLLPSLRASSF